MFIKSAMSIFYKNLRQTGQFYPIRTFKYQFPTRIYNTLHSYFSLFSVEKLKCSHKIGYSRHFPSANFWTWFKLWQSNTEEEKDPHLVKLTFVKPNGEEVVLHGKAGESVMQAVVRQSDAMHSACEGQLACTTCHVYVDPKIKHLFRRVQIEEDDLLDNAVFCKPNSRLSCQLMLTEEMTEARFGLPAATANMMVDGGKNGKTKKQIANSS